MLFKQLLKHSFNIPVEVTYPNGKVEQYGGLKPEVKIKINEKISLKALTENASIALGEAYMDGKIEVEGSLQKLITSAYANADSFLNNNKFKKFLPKQSHTKSHSKEDVQSHYDLGNDFYSLWLDKTMTYSCAYFENETDSLEQAQRNKVEHILKKLDPKPGKSLLDIGCGWGTLMLTAAKKYNLKVVGITLSEEQAKFVRARIKELGLEQQAEVILEDYREIQHEPFDYITSVGMFEHVGQENLGEYLLENLGHIIDAGMQVADLETLRRHYQKTLEIWDQNFNQVLPAVRKMHDERFIRMWDLYLQACAASFESGNIDCIQYLISKGPSGKNLPKTREYMYQA